MLNRLNILKVVIDHLTIDDLINRIKDENEKKLGLTLYYKGYNDAMEFCSNEVGKLLEKKKG